MVQSNTISLLILDTDLSMLVYRVPLISINLLYCGILTDASVLYDKTQLRNFTFFFFSFWRNFFNFFLHKNFLLTITNATKKELAKSVQPCTRDAVTKINRNSFI